ncbi:MAG: hypothetical protein P8183_15270 [Anaerolineae bacterium]|jgi:DNA-binding response OmpR family regulator
MRVILVAINQEWAGLVSEFLEESGYQVLMTSLLDEAVAIVRSRHLDGIVMTYDWAVRKETGQSQSLMEMAKDKIPTLTLIGSVFNEPIDAVYHRPMHEFATLPVSTEEITSRLLYAIEGRRSADDSI